MPTGGKENEEEGELWAHEDVGRDRVGSWSAPELQSCTSGEFQVALREFQIQGQLAEEHLIRFQAFLTAEEFAYHPIPLYLGIGIGWCYDKPIQSAFWIFLGLNSGRSKGGAI